MITLFTDIIKKPDLFDFSGLVEKGQILEYVKSRHLETLPDDLLTVWIKIGGGELFETETLLSPFGDPSMGDDIDGVNEFNYEKGMNRNFTIFHYGLGGLSVVDRETQKYHQIDEETYIIKSEFASFESWYLKVLRTEYAGRYELGLP